MKLLLFILPYALAATEMRFSPILLHTLISNGLMSPSEGIHLLSQSPLNHRLNSILGQVVTIFMENTRLFTPKVDGETPVHQYDINSVELFCYRNVLGIVRTLHLHQAWFQQNYNCAESNIDEYNFILYWTKRDMDYLLSLRPYNNRALNIVLQNLYGKVSQLLIELNTMHAKVQPYRNRIMESFGETVPPLPPFDIKFATLNPATEPKIHLSLLTQFLRLKLVSKQFMSFCKMNYSASYEFFLKNKGQKFKTANLNYSETQDAVVKELFLSISNQWMHCWFLGMRIKRAMPSPSKSAFGPGLVESFSIEINAMRELVEKADDAEKYYALEFSCTHIDYLLGCMRLALDNSFLSANDHDKCIEFFADHRILATDMINSLKASIGQIPV